MTKIPLKAAAMLLVCAALAVAQQQTLVLRDGRRITGEVTPTEEGYRVKMEFGEMTYPHDEVVEVISTLSPGDEYQRRLTQIDQSDPNALADLGEWAIGKNLSDLARENFEKALEIDPDHQKAQLLLRQVELLEKSIPGAEPPAGAEESAEEQAQISADWLIGPDDINRIRLEELAPRDNVRMEFRGDVLERFVQMMRDQAEFRENPRFDRIFYRWPAVQKVMYMLPHIERTNPSMKDDIRVLGDPRTLAEFRRRVWPVISAGCASAGCHGGAEPAGGLKLFNVRRWGENVDYTNFVILDGLEVKGENPRLLDRANVEDSLLLQYGLPADQAKFRHPTPLLRPMYTSRNAPGYRLIRNWISSLKGPAHPNYRLEYKPPLGMKLQFGTSALPQAPPQAQPPTEP